MTELLPVTVAAFALSFLALTLGLVTVVRIRSRRRRTRVAELVRATTPIPRPAPSAAEREVLPPLRGRDYGGAVAAGRFQPFEERPARAPAPGRPARRFAAHVAMISSAPVAVEEAPPPPDTAATAVSRAPEAEWTPLPPRGDAGTSVSEQNDIMSSTEPAVPVPVAVPPAREPKVTVLHPRPGPGTPMLPALLMHEVALGDAARALRGVLPGALTMTDGRRLRRAVAIGAATSVVAAAFAIRGRRR